MDQPVNNFWHTKNDTDTAIVFVHGIFSDSRTCWLAKTESVYWPDLIQTDPRLGNPSIYMAGYHTAIDAGDFALRDCAAQVFAALQRSGVDGAPPVLSYNRLVLICHSTGGIVVRHMLEREVEKLREKHLGLILLASPSLGSDWANIASRASSYYNQHLGSSLEVGDEILEDIHERFKELLHRRSLRLQGMEAAEHHIVFRQRIPSWLRWLIPPRWRVVDRKSAGQYFGQVRVMPGTDHFSIAKPNRLEHPSHDLLVDFFQDFGKPTRRVRGLESPQGEAAAPTPTLPHGVAAPVQESWPPSAERVANIYVTAGTSESPGSAAAIVCVVVDDLESLEQGWLATLASLQEAPEFQAITEVRDGLHSGSLEASVAHPLIRERVAGALAELIFEAYAAIAKNGVRSNDEYLALLSSVLADRISSNRSKKTIVRVAGDDTLVGAVRRIVDSVAGQRGSGILPVRVIQEEGAASVGSLVAGHVSQIVIEQFSGASPRFSKIYPAKLRVLYDAELKRYYTRQNPYVET